MNINESISKFLISRKTKIILIALGSFIVALLIFQLGIFVGAHKADFSYHWSDNYSRNFGGPRDGFLEDFRGKEFMNAHGTAGSIMSLDGDTILVKGGDNIEKIIKTDASTLIQQGRTNITINDLKTNDQIVVLGTPETDGSILAKMIRLFNPGDHFVEPEMIFRQGSSMMPFRR